MIEHRFIEAAGARFHVAIAGEGPPLLLLHGWPEFWLSWEPVMQRLAGRFRLIAPDLRGFGQSDKPARDWGAADHAADMLAVLDALGVERAGIVGHDVGGAVIQSLARLAPERCSGLFLFDFVHPGIGPALGTPDRLTEIWYQSFNQLPVAVAMMEGNEPATRAYFSHIIRHWCHRKDAFDEVMDAFIANFMRPGNLAGGFGWYRAAHAGRLATMRGETVPLPPITTPTCVRWGEHDPVLPFAFARRLGETFSSLDFEMFGGVGHFPHKEDPDRAAAEIGRFFDSLEARCPTK